MEFPDQWHHGIEFRLKLLTFTAEATKFGHITCGQTRMHSKHVVLVVLSKPAMIVSTQGCYHSDQVTTIETIVNTESSVG